MDAKRMRQRGVRFNDGQWGVVEKAAARAGLSAAGFVRLGVVRALEADRRDALLREWNAASEAGQ